MRIASDFWVSKTFWTAAAAIVTALGAAVMGEIPWPAAIAAVFAALQTVFLRDTMARERKRISVDIDYWGRNLADATEGAVASLRVELAQALQVTAGNAERAMTLAESVAHQAASLAVQAAPVREAVARQKPSPVRPNGGVKP